MAQRAGAVRLREVAAAAGVSHGTASNVFNRPEIVRQNVREKVHAAAERLGYAGPSPKGRLLRAGRANAIGIAAGEPLDYFFTDPWARALLSAVSAACDARGAGLALVSMAPGRELAWTIESALVDGFLLLSGGREHLVEMTRRRGLPFVALSLDTQEPGAPAIDIDDFGGALEAGRHVTELGHRRVAILGIGTADGAVLVAPAEVAGLRSLNVRERTRGYWAAMGEVGVAPEDVPLVMARGDRAGVAAAMELLFKGNGPRPTALLAMSDRLALGAMDWLAGRGVRVPGEVSVLGFDGTPGAMTARPGLSTVAQPFERIAERAVTAILDDRMPTRREILPLSLVIRGSTGPCADAAWPGPGMAAD